LGDDAMVSPYFSDNTEHCRVRTEVVFRLTSALPRRPSRNLALESVALKAPDIGNSA
jgi:hypothetical protein